MTHVERRQSRTGKETIHSGHFMVSHFEAEAQDDFDDLAVPVPDEEQNTPKVTDETTYMVPIVPSSYPPSERVFNPQHQQLSIETSLTKLFKCMTLAYRQKLTSPKWNRFKGIKLRWKEKIRLNNVIWRCWHMQFIKKQNTLVCQFASPLDVDTHVKPEATILEGKYWKRRAEAVIAEYKKWRMFHIMRLFGKGDSSVQDTISDMDTVESFSQCSDLAGNMLTDEDYLNFMSDTLFSTITNHQPFAFPDPREIARGASLADFIQPSLGPLQPNLEDYMDTLEPLQELLSGTPRLPPVPEESPLQPDMYPRYAPFPHAHTHTAHTHTAPATHPHLTIQGSINETAMLTTMSDQSVKNEQMQMYESNRMYSQPQEMQTNLIANHEVAAGYSTFDDHTQQNMYGNKPRLQYVNTHKTHGIVPQQESAYNKYNASIPPSASAPETVSLLQQGAPGRGGYRGARRPHYPPAAPYRGGPAHYLQAAPPEPYKQKTHTTSVQNRTFKMPSPPLVPATNTEVSSGTSAQPDKQSYRSNSLPLGAQLNADWTISQTQATEITAPRHTARTRSTSPLGAGGAVRRSRSTGGAGGEGGPRRPPPLCTVSSDPALPQATVMLAHLLNTQLPQNVYKLSSSTEEGLGSSEPTSSPIGKGQPSPIGSDVVSPHGACGGSPLSSPPTSPGGAGGAGRGSHLHAEQKRRYNINNGFDTLHHLIPHLNNNPANKVSKAAMLQKAAEYIRQLKSERNQIKEEMESLRQQIERLNNSISNCHSLLPATGAPVSRARAGRLREMFARHVANRTMQNWKYWLFSVVAAALVDSFSSCVSCGSSADLVRTTLLWAEQHCSLVEMRPAVLNSLRVLCTTTEILTSPERLPEEARNAVTHNTPLKAEPS